MFSDLKFNRRHFLSAAAVTITVTDLRIFGVENGEHSRKEQETGSMFERKAGNSFPELKPIDAGVLNVGYVEDGLGNGTPVILFAWLAL